MWYGDSTLETRFVSHYRLRAAGRPPGNDYFFRYDSTSGWRELTIGPEDLRGRPARDPLWTLEEDDLLAILLGAGDWEKSASVARKLAAVHPDRADVAFNLGVSFQRLGAMDSAAYWYRRAARLPDATPEMRRVAGGLRGTPATSR